MEAGEAKAQTQTQEHLLNDVWTFYFHDPNDTNWNFDSYVRMKNISSVEEFWSIHNQIKPKIHLGMFFLMREFVFPCWDDEHNRDGGCLSMKVLKQDMPKVWEDICVKLLGETVLAESKRKSFWNAVNGISTSPKKHFCIIKIWLKNNDHTLPADFALPNFHGELLYRSNQDNIQNNQ